MNRRLLPLFGLAALALLLGAGLLSLFLTHFRKGDSYPAYSTYRTDPQGAKALYAALEGMPGIAVSRNVAPFSELETGRDTTLLFLDVARLDLETVSEADAKALLGFVRSGGRLVFTLDPEDASWQAQAAKPAASSKPLGNGPAPTPPDQNPDAPPEMEPPPQPVPKPGDEPPKPAYSLLRTWGLRIEKTAPKKGDGDFEREADLVPADDPALADPPPAIPWHGNLVASADANPAPGANASPWRTVYQVGGDPVCVERRFGRGTVVLFLDSAPFGNEALLRQPQPGLLSWIAGSAHRIVFDETNHGLTRNTGVMVLARHYHLAGFFAGLALLLLLFVWQSTASFLPRRPASAAAPAPAKGRDSLTGLANLLRSHLPPARLLASSVDEWEAAFSRRLPDAAQRAAQARALLSADPRRVEKDPGATYRSLREILHHNPRENPWTHR